MAVTQRSLESIRKRLPDALASGVPDGGPEATLDRIQRRLSDANAAYVAERRPAGEELPRTPRLGLAVVSCMDCRLTGRLEPALGLRPGDAIMIRVAGNTVTGTDDLTRSLAIAVLEQGVRCILVIGHTECGMTRVDPLEFREKMSARGISSFALGGLITRDWLGIFSDETKNVRETIRGLQRARVLPEDVEVAGGLFDIRTGELTWLDN